MRASDLRARYLEFFRDRDHKKLPSSPLVPRDPTLLFTSAGMVQFKDVFAGRTLAPHPRVTTCQKCFRTTDIENVGRTAFHQTFFEMLGNFSFGDYFKQGAIELAWEFLTRELRLDTDRLWVTIYQDDDEAHDIWCDSIGVPKERIVRLGKEHNWWGPVGDGGPCGPDSEIHYDTGLDNGCGDPECAGVACDCNRFSEIWNLVFIQYDAQSDGSLLPLARQSIDTGMGLERTASTLQGVATNFDTDLFAPIVQAIEAAAPRSLAGEGRVHRNTLADHIRSVVFLLAEGVLPSNERQGYVLRRIVRRAIRAGEQAALPPGSMARLVDPVMESLGDVYPEILNVRKLAQMLIDREEETFRRTLREGERRLARLLDGLSQEDARTLPGDAAFELNDTYGFPVEMTQEIAAERGFRVDLQGYDRALERQRIRSRAGTELGAATAGDPIVSDAIAPTSFTGYDTLEQESVVQAIIQTKDGLTGLIVQATPFYAEAGGQVTDTGHVENLSQPGSARVVRVAKDDRDVYLHHVEDLAGTFAVGDRCHLAVDSARRERIRRNHTATHLLHAALRAVLGPHVTQAGSLVDEIELRFDFSHFEKMSLEQIHAVEDFANAAVWADHAVDKHAMPFEEAIASGAIGLFDDEYRGKAEVRVVEVNGVSRELCGGTHVGRSGEIGLIKVLSEESVAAGTRRLRAITAHAVLSALRSQAAYQHRMTELLGVDPEAGVEQLRQQIDTLSAQLARHNQAQIRALVDEITPGAAWVGDVHLVVARADLPSHGLEELADEIEQRVPPAVVVLIGAHEGRALVVCKVSKTVTRIRAGDIVKPIAQALGGGGGGAPTFAQGGGPKTDMIDAVLASAKDQVTQALS